MAASGDQSRRWSTVLASVDTAPYVVHPMSEIVFRRAYAQDLPAIVALLADDALGAGREDTSTPLAQSYLDAFRAIEADPNQLLVVAVDGPEVIGTLQLTFIPGLSRKGALRGQIEKARQESSSHKGAQSDPERLGIPVATTMLAKGILQAFIVGPNDTDPGPACLGQPDTMHVPIKQLRVQELLESDDVAAHAGFPHPEGSCCLPEAAVVNGRKHIVQTAECVAGPCHGLCALRISSPGHFHVSPIAIGLFPPDDLQLECAKTIGPAQACIPQFSYSSRHAV